MRCESKDGHLLKEMLLRLKIGEINGAERREALDHISGCDECAGAFAELFAEEELLPLPPQFAEGVNRRLSQTRVTATPLSLVLPKAKPYMKKEKDTRREFQQYSCRVAIAACLALLLLFSGTFNTGMETISKSRVLNPDLSIVNHFTQRLSDFTNDIIHWEVKDND